MRISRFTVAVAFLFVTASAFGTTFVVPTDEEMVTKSSAIVIGTVEGSFVQRLESDIETVYEIRIERALKGQAARAGELLRIVSPGGVIGDEGVFVPGAAHFDNGEKVLVFLTRDGSGWRTTDMTLGKFRFAVSSAGERLLVRDAEDAEGWDRDGKVHREPVRREAGFLRFIEDRVAGRRPVADYAVDAAAVSLPADTTTNGFAGVQTNATYAPKTYTDNVSDGTTYRGIRWPNISAGVTFYKRADQNISGASDGGVSVIQGGLAAWTNECGSVINLQYGGTTTTVSKNFDTVHVVEFNDPQNRISGSWTGSGTIATTFLSFGSSHSFAGDTWWTMTDADVVFQDGYPATHAAFATAMTHELGHGVGWRHANKHYIRNADYSDAACDSTVEECTTAAIMNSVANSAYGFNLQPWDVHAAQAVYPGGTCSTCTPPSITGQPQSVTISSGSAVTLSVTATGTAPSYQWYTGTSGSTANPISGATGATLRVTPSVTTSYWVRVSNACGTVNSATATVTVTTTPPPTGGATRGDFNGDGRPDIIWRNASSGANRVWFMNDATYAGTGNLPSANAGWLIGGVGDFNGDGYNDIVWRNDASAQTIVWFMRGTTYVSAQATSSANSSWTLASVYDIDGDGDPDFLWRNKSNGDLIAWLMNGTTYVSGLNVPSATTAYTLVGTGDFNRDGKYDFVWQNTSDGSIYVWLMNGATYVSATRVGSAAPPWTGVAVADYDRDGDADIVFRNRSTGQNVLWHMSNTTFAGSVAIPTDASTAWSIVGPR